MLYFSKKELDCLKYIPNNMKLETYFFNINESVIEENVSYELLLLIKDNSNNYKIAALTRGKFEDYYTIAPYESINRNIFIDYPIKNICLENNIYSYKIANYFKSNLSNLPNEIIKLILKYKISKEVDFNLIKFNFKLEKDINNDFVVDKFYTIFTKPIFLTISN